LNKAIIGLSIEVPKSTRKTRDKRGEPGVTDPQPQDTPGKKRTPGDDE
jgi:hypothetical protein